MPGPLDATLSIVIPTLNAGPEFALLLRKLRTQTGLRELEIVVVDSGSTDGTVELARAAGARVVEIAAADFSHSSARNLGADQARGDHLLFMVQDAYPIGERWAYGMLRYLQDHAGSGVVAVSCAEYCRNDSDIMVDCMIQTHYRFLGCQEADRIGQHIGDAHEQLRAMGQLSDVACLIPRTRFMQYRYRGTYAEDLDLGVRLIRDRHRIAMLASVKVIHSHNRGPHYYLKRGFVDGVFLAEVFTDLAVPRWESAAGLVSGAVYVGQCVSEWTARLATEGLSMPLPDLADAWLDQLARWPVPSPPHSAPMRLDDQRLAGFVDTLAQRALGASTGSASALRRDARRFVDGFIVRFNHFNRYAAAVFPGDDESLRREWAGAACKTYAATLGALLAELHLDSRARPASHIEARTWIEHLRTELKAGI